MRLRALAVTLLAAAGLTLTPSVAAVAASTDVHGADVSWPQCGKALPTGAAFGVVGVNTGVGIETNPCVSEELTWASATAGTGSRPASLYVMSEDPGQAAAWWPQSDATKAGTAVHPPTGTCDPAAGKPYGLESDACAYVYGYDLAEEDVTTRGIADPSHYRWWIDVETSNTWADSMSRNPADATTRNRAVLEGMVAGFKTVGVTPGLYSTSYQWKLITGTTPATSPLVKLPSWIASAGAVGSAEGNCYASGLTPGSTVALAQYQGPSPSGVADYDLACHRLTAAPKPTVTGTGAVDRRLTAHPGRWSPSPVTLHRWKRNGKPIAGATGSTYRTVAADAGHSITVTVTGTKAGWTTIARTSRAHRIAVPVSRLAAGRTLGTGRSLLAPNGRYRLTQQSNGDLVLYKDNGKTLWSSHRFGRSYTTTLRRDGNLVTSTRTHHVVWATRTAGKRATHAVMQSNGNFVLYTASGKAVWATHTSGR